MTVANNPCRICGMSAFDIVVDDERVVGGPPVKRRACFNAECRSNGPASEQRFGDKV